MTILENRNRLNILLEFRKLVVDYFNLEFEPPKSEPKSELAKALRAVRGEDNKTEGQGQVEIRAKINLMLNKISDAMYSAGIRPVLYYSPPPMIGGLAGNIDLVQNIFNLHRFQIGCDELLDFIERTIGIYENDKTRAKIRVFNPFFWIGLIFDYIARLPIKLLGKLGFNQSKVEDSLFGKITKGLIWFLLSISGIAVSILTITEKLGYLDKLKSIIKNLIG